MKIELKNVKYVASMSEETACFSADVFINDKKIAYASNRGHGGPTDYYVHDFKDTAILKEAEDYCKGLPDVYVEKYDFSYNQTLESKIDDLLNEYLIAKEAKVLEKKFLKGICYGSKDNYSVLSWTNTTLEAMLKNEVGRQRIAKVVKDLRAKGETILNTNLTEF